MKKIISFVILASACFALSCASAGDKLRSGDSELYEKIIDKPLYILDEKTLKLTGRSFEFKADGTVLGLEGFKWKYDTKEKSILILDGKREYNVIFTFNQTLKKITDVHTLSIGSGEKQYFVFDKSVIASYTNDVIKKVNEEWAKTNKKSYTDVKTFLENNSNDFSEIEALQPLYKEANNLLTTILDEKVLKYLSSKYPRFKDYFNANYQGVSSGGGNTDARSALLSALGAQLSSGNNPDVKINKFYEIFRYHVLYVNQTSGRKQDIEFRPNSAGDLEVVYKNLSWGLRTSANEIVLTFKLYKNNVTLMSLKRDGELNPNAWQMEAPSYIIYPGAKMPDSSNIDTDLLNKVK